jgi:hypothetical protein
LPEPWNDAAWKPGNRLSLLTADERAPFRLLSRFAPAQEVVDSNDTLSSHSFATQLGVPLRISPEGILLATARINTTQFSTGAVLPVSGMSIPDNLWDVRFGLFGTRKLSNGWQVGGLFNLGSASDELFNSVDELTLTSLAFVSIPVRGRDAWNLSLFYSPTSQIAFPIPGVAYVWRPSDQLEAQIGLPASLVYAPNDTFLFRARYTPVTDVFVEARQKLLGRWELFSRYQIINESYFLANRENRRDRFFQFEHQLSSGLSYHLPAGFTFDLSAGYLFGRRYFQDSDFDLGSKDLVQVDSGVVYSAQFIWTRSSSTQDHGE